MFGFLMEKKVFLSANPLYYLECVGISHSEATNTDLLL